MKRQGLVFTEAVTSNNIGGRNVAYEITEALMEKSFQVNHKIILKHMKMKVFWLLVLSWRFPYSSYGSEMILFVLIQSLCYDCHNSLNAIRNIQFGQEVRSMGEKKYAVHFLLTAMR